MFNRFLQHLRLNLDKPLLGPSAWAAMMPSSRVNMQDNIAPDAKKAAVMLLLYPVDDNPYIVFTRRHEYDGPHSGQVSFPGGKAEFGESMWDAALRETYEEIGVQPNKMNFIGELTPIYIPFSNYLVYPMVGTTNEKPEFVAQVSEVAGIIETPIDCFFRYDVVKTFDIYRNNTTITAPYYSIDSHKIWGATAMIMAEFLTLVPHNG